VERAFEALERLGVVATRAGEGTFVGLTPPDADERERRCRLAELARDAVAGAAVLGFSVGELLDAVAEWRDLPPPED
jgi:DNA-binding transcriptional regulator YhcF (GntR family)